MYQFQPKQSKFKQLMSGPYVMYLFLAIQVIIFALMELSGVLKGTFSGSTSSATLYKFGAMYPVAVTDLHHFWRFVTPIFVHIGFVHFGVNSLTLYFCGRILEPLIGHWRFFVLYLMSGILGNLLSFAFANPVSLSAGASTSIFGMFAAFLILGRMYPNQPLINQMYQNMKLLIIMNLVLNLFDSSVDIWGHLGGAIGGVIMMLLLDVPKRYKAAQTEMNPHFRILAGIVLVFMIVFCLFYGFGKA
ncbi:rhomboid family intramembrane serine protease [Vagococcus silagei]|uniref:Rhomboid family intramembrane serine protease n=1 Tax=Vagococcus silagei TaxID=2508885 RepID=A0A4S3B550_9ENTE|nr:rhomboid family intramembrane serine protease [Vagococcus silagei]THB61618.1 rhomboid family intramembrane serine protease [Vagococcus silagei]